MRTSLLPLGTTMLPPPLTVWPFGKNMMFLISFTSADRVSSASRVTSSTFSLARASDRCL